MNILMLSWRDPKHPTAGGAEQVMHEHAKGWIKAGHKVTLFSSYYKGGRREENIDGVKIIRAGFQVLGVHIFAFLWYIFGKHDKFNLIIDQFHGIPFFTPLYSTLPKIAVIQEVAREVWFLNQLPKPFNFIFGAIGYITEPLYFLFYRNTPFITGSESAKKDLINIGVKANKITVINHGIIIDHKPKTIKKNKIKTIIFLGALSKDKGIEDAIDAFKIISRKGKYLFWIVGKGSQVYIEHLKNKVSDSSIKNATTFWGYVLPKDKFNLLARSHVLVNPSVKEGWGLVNIEANAMATPVVAYNSKGLTDSVRNGTSGVLCSTNNPRELAKELINITKDIKTYKKFQEGALAWSKQFSWTESIKRSLDMVEKVAKN